LQEMIYECLLLFMCDDTGLNTMIFCVRMLKLITVLLFKTENRFPLKKIHERKQLCYKVTNSALQWVKNSNNILYTYLRNIIMQRSATHCLLAYPSLLKAVLYFTLVPLLTITRWKRNMSFSKKSVKRQRE
jgi:hypothetical protein